MMSKSKVQRKPPTTNDPDLLTTVEAACSRAATITRDSVNVILGLEPKDTPTVYAVALDHVADELEALSERALNARTGGAA